MSDPLLDLDYKPHLPPKTDYGIGIINCAVLRASIRKGWIGAVTDASDRRR